MLLNQVGSHQKFAFASKNNFRDCQLATNSSSLPSHKLNVCPFTTTCLSLEFFKQSCTGLGLILEMQQLLLFTSELFTTLLFTVSLFTTLLCMLLLMTLLCATLGGEKTVVGPGAGLGNTLGDETGAGAAGFTSCFKVLLGTAPGAGPGLEDGMKLGGAEEGIKEGLKT